MDINDSTLEFIRLHADEDVNQLALRGCKDPAVDLPFALQQIQGRQKAKGKLPEYAAHPNVLFPPLVSMEQCSSYATAHYKARLFQGACMADLSGGFGVDTFAFATTFNQCHYVEPSHELCELVRHNAKAFCINNIQIFESTMEEAFPSLPDVDLIYLDPSRRDVHGNRVVGLRDCTPNLPDWKARLLEKAPKVLVKLSPMLDIRQALGQLPETAEVHGVAVRGECKELLFLLTRKACDELKFHAVNLLEEGAEVFTFSDSEERGAVPQLAAKVGRYLLEPNAAVLKVGAFKSVAVRHGLSKLHPHTHLYTCDELPEQFPGRKFEVLDVFDYHKKNAIQHLQGLKHANVSARNFPMGSVRLQQTLGLADGGDIYLFGATLANEQKIIVVCKKSPTNS